MREVSLIAAAATTVRAIGDRHPSHSGCGLPAYGKPVLTLWVTIGPALLLTLALLVAFGPIATDLYLPGLPAMADALGADASGVQLTLTTFLAGLAFGQLVMGPISDRFGRRKPLLVSAAVCVLAGIVAATAPTLPVLIAARLVQGFAGAGGLVIGRAVIADLVTGRAAARALTLMMTVGGVAPVLAPLIGGVLADPVGWRGMLWTVTGLCAAMLLAVLLVLPETHTSRGRGPGGYRIVLRSAGFWADTAVFASSFAMMMAYISASPFVYQRVVGLSEIAYGVSFGLNACGLIAAGAIASRLVERVEPRRIVAGALTLEVAATASLLALVLAGAPAWTYPIPIFFAVSANGGVAGPSAALAMGRVPEVAGTGSALLGFSQFALGALVSPLVGLGGEDSALVPAVVMLVAALAAVAASALNRPVAVRT
ncbi:multidrug effflux MFS transporter [Actinoplanes sp. LDG1-06]|uniref:Multidrug effflux MFS transporter n=1 Tax=Paractinoplanes ovalisporus TaxID=2810368 RepID=A0ABS2AS71_9ACTN|nr:multidrug effflux MFS transporter [Actinoplanes ovalisporus]MBM2621994.1 multidrug effflux MFS transporter [Actinoplanes ovalisporus]